MSYTPNAHDKTEPTEDRFVESAAAEFREIKDKLWDAIDDIQGEIDNIVGSNTPLSSSAIAELFDGDDVKTSFPLLRNPGKLANLDVSISGVTQRPGIDYVWVNPPGTMLDFVVPPIGGVKNILVRYTEGLPEDSDGSIRNDLGNPDAIGLGDALVAVKQPFTGAVARTQHQKNADTLSVKDFGALGDGVTDDTAAFVAATSAAAAGQFGIVIPAGTYKLSAPWHISAQGTWITATGKVVLSFTNPGNCVEVVGDAGAAGYVYDIHFGTVDNPIWINGNAATTNALLWRAVHHGSASVKVWNCITGHKIEFAVCNNFWIVCSVAEAVSSILVPTYGIYADRRNVGEDAADNCWWAPILEGIVTGVGEGIHLEHTNRNKFYGGTSEGNKIGVRASPVSVGDAIQGLYCEVNSGTAHFELHGTLISLIDCFGASGSPAPSVAFCLVGATAVDCRILGGNVPGINILAGAMRTQVIGNAHSAGVIVDDLGTQTLIVEAASPSRFSRGIRLGSGAQALQAYDYGEVVATLTPSVSGTITLNPTFNALGWVKVGRLVTVTGLLLVQSVAAPVGMIRVGNLPFFTDTSQGSRAAVAIRAAALAATATGSITGHIVSNDNAITLAQFINGTSTPIASSVIAGSEFYFSASYIAVS